VLALVNAADVLAFRKHVIVLEARMREFGTLQDQLGLVGHAPTIS
jgi:hypothetical protein